MQIDANQSLILQYRYGRLAVCEHSILTDFNMVDGNNRKSTPFHVCHVASALKGGSEIMVSQLAANQLAHGHRVTVVYSPTRDRLEDFRPLFPRETAFVPWPVGRDVNLRSDIRAYGLIVRILSELQPDIVHLHNSKAGALGRIACRKLRIPCVYTPHGLPFLRKDTAWWKCKLHFTVEWMLALFGGCLVGLSQSEWNAIRSMPCRKALINNGIDTKSISTTASAWPEQYPRKDFRIVLSGRIETPKNPHFVAHLAEQCPEHWEWIWIGDGSLAYALDESGRFKVTGWVSREIALSLVRSADVFLQASLWEGMSFALLEAMALERPCVVSNAAGNRDVIQNGVSGYVCGNIAEYRAALEKLATEPSEARRIGVAAHGYVADNFSLDIVNRRWDELYSDLLCKAQPRYESSDCR
jgi:glycosyltransferase involved in cell wall biosynthesis